MELGGTGRGERSREGIESAAATIVGGLTFYLTLAREGEGREVRGGKGKEGESEG